MSVGLAADKSQVDLNSGQLARTIQTWAGQAQELRTWADSTPDAILEQPPYGYTSAEIALLKSAIHDMATLADVYFGEADLTPPQDLGRFSRQLMGIWLQ